MDYLTFLASWFNVQSSLEDSPQGYIYCTRNDTTFYRWVVWSAIGKGMPKDF